MKKKIPKIWNFYFLFANITLYIHFFRYLNFYFTHSVPVYHGTIDYDFYSNISLIKRIICFLISIILIKSRIKFPVSATSISWLMVWFLLSNEYDLYLFIPVTTITLFSFLSLIFYNFKYLKNDKKL